MCTVNKYWVFRVTDECTGMTANKNKLVKVN